MMDEEPAVGQIALGGPSHESNPETDLRPVLRMVELLEAACHRLRDQQEDEATREALTRALVAFVPPLPPGAPPHVIGLANVAHARARLALNVASRRPADTAKLCDALSDLRAAITSIEAASKRPR